MYERFTNRSRKVMQLAIIKAKQRGDFYLDVNHLLVAIIENGNGLAANVLRQLNVDVVNIIAEAAIAEPELACDSDFVDHLLHTINTKKALEHANEISVYLGHNYIGTEHLLLGLLKTSHPVVAKVFNKAGIDYNCVYDKIVVMLSFENNTPTKEEIAINFYRGVLKRIIKACEQNDVKEIKKIAKRAILDGDKWNIS